MLSAMAELGATATYQFYRTERWLGRIEAIYNGTYTRVGNSDERLDHILAFFLNCHHIKDWLKNGPKWRDEVEPALKQKAIEQFVTESAALSICADLCNGNKHFQLDKTRSGSTPMLQSTHSHMDTTTQVPLRTVRYTFRTQRGDEDAYALAQGCFEAWRKFIRESTTESLQALADRNSKHRASRPVR
jgi:hypothetical protein